MELGNQYEQLIASMAAEFYGYDVRLRKALAAETSVDLRAAARQDIESAKMTKELIERLDGEGVAVPKIITELYVLYYLKMLMSSTYLGVRNLQEDMVKAMKSADKTLDAALDSARETIADLENAYKKSVIWRESSRHALSIGDAEYESFSFHTVVV